jgi:CHASE3 domain sensor protein
MSTKSRLSKKSILIAVVSVLITGLVVTAVLVSIRMFTESDLEKLKVIITTDNVATVKLTLN